MYSAISAGCGMKMDIYFKNVSLEGKCYKNYEKMFLVS